VIVQFRHLPNDVCEQQNWTNYFTFFIAGLKLKKISKRNSWVLSPISHGRITESHFAGIVTFIPLGMAVGEHEILTFAVDLPVFGQRWIGCAPNAILRVIILVRVLRIELQSGGVAFGSRRIATQNKSRWK
jgi:hypothetical protein